MAGEWKITLIPDEIGDAGNGTADWWEDAADLPTEPPDFTFRRLGLERDTGSRTEFMSNAVDERDAWQAHQTKIAAAAVTAAAWTVILNNNDPDAGG